MRLGEKKAVVSLLVICVLAAVYVPASAFADRATSGLPDNLIAHWTMDELDGGKVHDVQADAWDAVHGGALADGRFGSAIQFTPSSQTTIDVGRSLTPDKVADELTVGMWVYPTDLQNNGHLLSTSPNDLWPGSLLFYVTGDGKLGANIFEQYYTFPEPTLDSDSYHDGYSGIISNGSVVSGNTWQHVTLTYKYSSAANTGRLALYVDGNKVAGGTYTVSPQRLAFLDSLVFGLRRDNSARFAGRMDDIQIYDRTLSADEIGTVYGYQPDPGAPQPPQARSPRIIGTAAGGETLTGEYSYYSNVNSAETGTELQWYRADTGDGSGRSERPGATGSTYVVTPEDVGKYLLFGVTPKDADGRVGEQAMAAVYVRAPGAVSDTPLDGVAARWAMEQRISGKVMDLVSGEYDTASASLAPGNDGYGNALSLDGSGYLQAERKAVNGPADNQKITVGMWIRPDAAAGKVMETSPGYPEDGAFELDLNADGSLSARLLYWSGYAGTGQRNVVYDSGFCIVSTAAGAIRPGEWSHVAITYEPSNLGGGSGKFTIYVDGGIAADATQSNWTGPINMGGVKFGGGFTGLMDEIQLYDRVLAQNEIGNLMLVGVAPEIKAEPPQARAVKITGNPKAGNTVTGAYSYYSNLLIDESGSEYQWYSAPSADPAGKDAISGATDSTYLVRDEDAGKYLFFGVTPKDKDGRTGDAALSDSVLAKDAALKELPADPAARWTMEELVNGNATKDVVSNSLDRAYGALAESRTGLGKALRLNGSTSNYLDVTRSATSTPTPEQATVAMWLRPDELLNSSLVDSTVNMRSDGSGWPVDNTMKLQANMDGSLTASLLNWSGGPRSPEDDITFDGAFAKLTTAPGVLKKGEWNHLAFTYIAGSSNNPKAGEFSIYLNGSLVKSARFNQSHQATNLTLLRFGSGFAGRMDEVIVYERALGADDIREIYDYVPSDVVALPRASDVALTVSADKTTLTGTYAYSDERDAAEGASQYKWYRGTHADGSDMVQIPGQDQLSYTITSADLDNYVFFEVTPVTDDGRAGFGTASDGHYYGEDSTEELIRSNLFLEEAGKGTQLPVLYNADGAEWALDGNFDKYQGFTGVQLPAKPEQNKTGKPWPLDPADLSGTFYYAYDDNYFYMGAIVKDDIHKATTGGSSWQGDSLQFSFLDPVRGFRTEFAASYADGVSDIYRHADGQAVLLPDSIQRKFSRNEDTKTTYYEFKMPWGAVMFGKPASTNIIPFTVLMNDNDVNTEVSNRGWVEWTDGIGSSKDMTKAAKLELLEQGEQWSAWLTGPTVVAAGSKARYTLYVPNYSTTPLEAEIAIPQAGYSGTVTVPPGQVLKKTFAITIDKDMTIDATVTARGKTRSSSVRVTATMDHQAVLDWLDHLRDVTLPALESKLSEAEALGHHVDYQRVNARVIKEFTTYGKDDLGAGKDYLPRAQYMARTMENLADEAMTQLQDFIDGKAQSFEVPRYVTGQTQPNGYSMMGETTDGVRPIIFQGSGMFDRVVQDVPKFHDLGQNIVDYNFGPTDVITRPTPEDLAAGKKVGVNLTRLRNYIQPFLDNAAANGTAVNLATVMHYWPVWTYEDYPDLKIDNLYANTIDVEHPMFWEVEETFLRAVIPLIKDHPALQSVTLTSEPIYVNNSSSAYHLAGWRTFLKEKYGDVAAMNSQLATNFASFDDVPAFNLKESFEATPLLYEYLTYKNSVFTGVHQKMADIIHELAPDLPVHIKTMGWNLVNRQPLLTWGIDPEQFVDLTNLNGTDNGNSFELGVGGYLESFYLYDMLASYQKQPGYNSEDHVINDGNEDYVPEAAMSVENTLWGGALHGRTMSTLWVWDRSYDRVNQNYLQGSLLNRPDMVARIGKVALDMNRLSYELGAFQHTQGDVAIFTDFASTLYDTGGTNHHYSAMRRAYEALSQSGHRASQISEDVINGHNDDFKLSDYKVIVLPEVTHLEEETLRNILAWQRKGGMVVLIGSEADVLRFDGYNKALDASLRDAVLTNPNTRELSRGQTDAQLRAVFKEILDGLHPDRVIVYDKSTGEPLSDGEWRTAVYNGKLLLSVMNYSQTPKELVIKSGAAEIPSTDLKDLLNARPVPQTVSLGSLEHQLYELPSALPASPPSHLTLDKDVVPAGTPQKVTVRSESHGPVTYRIASGHLPQGASLNPFTGDIALRSDVAPGAYTFKVEASNGLTATATFTLYVGALKQQLSGLADMTKSVGDEPFAVSFTSNAIAEHPEFSYESSNAGVAEISADGIVTLRSAGETTITVRAGATQSYGPAQATFVLTVHSSALLKTLTVGSGSLVPEFRSDITSYNLRVPTRVANVEVRAETVNDDDVMVLNGSPLANGQGRTIRLRVGDNTLTIRVKAQNGTIRQYSVVVTRQTGVSPKPTPNG
ncbi:LamG-like jellyroll fold domain-containing protein [Actinopolymorpha alba]|uniref:LamG-like jellyroll fold domain-containing protein n=1 Tax=Actinopolymorpha alba TaxID=533267 RepID=UPI000360B95A|nr:LamG-like jellyroll fold domain-containing protein [Actinopolymorpha alba]